MKIIFILESTFQQYPIGAKFPNVRCIIAVYVVGNVMDQIWGVTCVWQASRNFREFHEIFPASRETTHADEQAAETLH